MTLMGLSVGETLIGLHLEVRSLTVCSRPWDILVAQTENEVSDMIGGGNRQEALDNVRGSENERGKTRGGKQYYTHNEGMTKQERGNEIWHKGNTGLQHDYLKTNIGAYLDKVPNTLTRISSST